MMFDGETRKRQVELIADEMNWRPPFQRMVEESWLQRLLRRLHLRRL